MVETSSRRDLILDKAAELFARKGVAATTVREIADSVGLLSGSLYHHFESKDAIVDQLLHSYLDDLLERYRAAAAEDLGPREMFDRLVHASFEAVDAHPHATEIFQNDFNLLRNQPRFKYLEKAAGEVQKTWLAVIERGNETGVFRTSMQPKVIYRIVRDVVWLSVRWYEPKPDYGLSELADDCTSTLLDGISAKAAPRRKAAR